MEWGPLVLTVKLALVTTFILFVIGLPIAYFLAFSKIKLRPVVSAIISLPLILPPTVLGYYLLMGFSPNNAMGSFLEDILGIRLVFTFIGLVFASIIYSLPFMVHPIQAGFTRVPKEIIEASYTLGKSRWTTFRKIIVPNSFPSLLSGIVLTFAHTIGEFGIVLMIGGNIPGKTRVASIAIYDAVESLNYAQANTFSLILFGLSFAILLAVFTWNGRLYNVNQ